MVNVGEYTIHGSYGYSKEKAKIINKQLPVDPWLLLAYYVESIKSHDRLYTLED